MSNPASAGIFLLNDYFSMRRPGVYTPKAVFSPAAWPAFLFIGRLEIAMKKQETKPSKPKKKEEKSSAFGFGKHHANFDNGNFKSEKDKGSKK